uniref:Uncharacterized protein n=1 Tax=Romanomermis culicivorax TaxID=13658 RepID=A0A915IZB9_ROMCU
MCFRFETIDHNRVYQLLLNDDNGTQESWVCPSIVGRNQHQIVIALASKESIDWYAGRCIWSNAPMTTSLRGYSNLVLNEGDPDQLDGSTAHGSNGPSPNRMSMNGTTAAPDERSSRGTPHEDGSSRLPYCISSSDEDDSLPSDYRQQRKGVLGVNGRTLTATSCHEGLPPCLLS